LNIRSVTIPPLGSGLDGLVWFEVKNLIIKELSDFQEVEILLYEPKASPQSDKMPAAIPKAT